MKARVTVTLKNTVLDPQGQAIHQAAARLGFKGVQAVRQGKIFDLELNGLSEEQVREQVERFAQEVLTNPVIEEFHYEIEN